MRVTGQVIQVRHVGSGWVPAGGNFVLPRAYTATIDDIEGQPGIEVVLVVDVDNFARTVCREVRVRSLDGAPVTPATLRRLRLSDLLRASARAATEKVERDPGGGLKQAPMTAADLQQFYSQFSGARKPRQGSPLTDEQLRKIADLYRGATAQGRAPVRAIQEAEHVSRATASRWVAAARERGFLEERSKA